MQELRKDEMECVFGGMNLPPYDPNTINVRLGQPAVGAPKSYYQRYYGTIEGAARYYWDLL